MTPTKVQCSRKTIHGYGVQFLADLKFGLIWAFAVYPAGDGFRPEIGEWVIEAKRCFGWESMTLTSDREYTIAKAIHQWHAEDILHYGPRANTDRRMQGIFLEEDFELHELVRHLSERQTAEPEAEHLRAWFE